MKEYIEEEFLKRGILIVPDCIANAGGVISSYSEHRGHNIERMFDTVQEKIRKTTRAVLREGLKKNPRHIAMSIAQKKIKAKADKN
jgi:glutamate dehydrogenase (NAD(P)+)